MPKLGERQNLWVRFSTKVERRPNGCLEWTAASYPDGYGNFVYEGRSHPAHRLAYIWFVGPLPEGLEIDHKCRNRACVEPTHLEPVTHLENVRRGNRVGPQPKRDSCGKGHLFDVANTWYARNGQRKCRACAAINQRLFHARRRAARQAATATT
jgi:hypothetical protein